jgi:hypothetical protein
MKPEPVKYFTGLVGLGLLSLLLGGCGGRTNAPTYYYAEPEAALTPGSYAKELTINDFTQENLVYRPYLRDYVGHWELKLEERGRFSASNRNFLFEGLYSSSMDEITFYGTNWLGNCFFSAKADEINYRWHTSDQNLDLLSLEDDCFERSLVLTAHSWIPANNSTPLKTANIFGRVL